MEQIPLMVLMVVQEELELYGVEGEVVVAQAIAAVAVVEVVLQQFRHPLVHLEQLFSRLVAVAVVEVLAAAIVRKMVLEAEVGVGDMVLEAEAEAEDIMSKVQEVQALQDCLPLLV